MPDTSDQWTALDSQNERLVDAGSAPADPAAASPAAPDGPALPARPPTRPGLTVPPASGGGSAAGPQAGRHRQRAVAAAAVAVTAAAALAAAGTLAAGPASAGVSHSQAATPKSWQTVLSLPAPPDDPAFTAVTATSRHRAWAFGNLSGTSGFPTAWRLTAAGWNLAPSPGKAGDTLAAAGASSARNVWAFTQQGARSRAFRWNGTSWAEDGSFTRDVGATVVLSRHDVWAFGAPNSARSGLGARHYNGHRWKRIRSGRGLNSGSALSSHSIWAAGGKKVAHWNGHRWSRRSVAAIIPPNTQFCHPAMTGIYARSSTSVWAVGAGNCEDEIGPGFLLHYNGHRWRRAARHSAFGAPLQVVPDGNRALWIPAFTGSGGPVRMVRYSAGALRSVPMPVGARRLSLLGIAAVPHRTTAFAVGATFKRSMPGVDQAAAVFEFER